MPDDRKELLCNAADVALQLWALTQALSREPSPNWEANASVVDDQIEALKKVAADMRSRC